MKIIVRPSLTDTPALYECLIMEETTDFGRSFTIAEGPIGLRSEFDFAANIRWSVSVLIVELSLIP